MKPEGPGAAWPHACPGTLKMSMCSTEGYNGDGKADMMDFRPSDGTWNVRATPAAAKPPWTSLWRGRVPPACPYNRRVAG